MRRPPWAKHGAGPWGDNSAWWFQPGARAWRGFGRRIFFGFVLVFALGVLGLIAVGALLATFIANAIPVSGWVVVALTPLVAAAVVVTIVRYVSRTWRPVGDLVRAAGSLADGDYSVRVPPVGPSAIQPVARSFNEMASRLEAADEQRRRLLADLGHELRTPLTVVRGEIEAMIDGVHRMDSSQLEMLLDEVAVMERLLEDLRTLSLAESGALTLEFEPTDLAALVSDVADGHRRSATEQGVELEVHAVGDGEIAVDAVRIREVLSNLVVNALRAMPEGGVVTLRTAVDGTGATLEVLDTGVGIAADEIDRVFERFRKGSTSSGSGLGLTISRDLVEAHGGVIELDSEQGVGTRVRVRLPRTGVEQ